MRFVAVLWSLLVASIGYGQTWTTVAPPNRPLEFLGSSMNIVWKYPFDQGCPAGVYEVSNAIVDRSQKVGAWSQPKTITVKEGWQLMAGGWNQPVTKDDVGLVWKVKCINIREHGEFKNGAEISFSVNPYPNYSIGPYSGDSPYIQFLNNCWPRYRDLTLLKYGGRNTVVAPPPVAYGTAFPYRPFEVAWCRVTETGETALSPIGQITPSPYNDLVIPNEVGEVRLFTQDDPHPQGTIGYHVYVRFNPTDPWQRVPAPHCYEDPVRPDDWLFQWWDNQPRLTKLAPNAPTHQAAAPPQSRLNELQLKLKNENGDIVIPAGLLGQKFYDCYCPVVDEYGPGNNKGFRKISSEGGGKWKLVQQVSQSGHSYWPMLVVLNQYSTWEDVVVQGTKGSSAALAYSGWSGGQAFGNTFNRCSFGCNGNPAGVTHGMLISDRCSRWPGDHTASEQLYEDCKFAGEVGIGHESNQAANNRFNHTYVNGYGDRRGSAIWSASPNVVNFTGGLYCDSVSGVLIRNGWHTHLYIQDIWVDQGFDHFVDSNTNGSVSIELDGGKLNAWGVNPNFARLVEQEGPTVFTIKKVRCQMNALPFDLLINNAQYNFTDLRLSDTNLTELLVLREPTEDQTKTEWVRFFRTDATYPIRQPLGFKLTVPGSTFEQKPLVFRTLATPVTIPESSRIVKIKLPGQTTTTDITVVDPAKTVIVPGQQVTLKRENVVVPDKTIVFNSLTGRQFTRRVDWWGTPTVVVLP